MVRYIFVFGILVAVTQRSFVSTVPVTDTDKKTSEVKGEDNVQELENLKHSLGRTISMMRSQTDMYRDMNGKKEAHSVDTEEVQQNGQLMAKLFQRMDTDPEAPDKGGQPRARVRTEVEVPSEGLHHVTLQRLPAEHSMLAERKRHSPNLESPRDTPDNVEGPNNTPDGTQQYSPLDMAEYVFWTGDEKSVSLVIEEFLQDGVMSREDAIVFLQEIKQDLEFMKNHFSRYGSNIKDQNQSSMKEKNQEDYQVGGKPETQQKRTVSEQIRSELNQLRQLQEVYKKRNAERKAATLYFGGTNQGKNSGIDSENTNKEDYEELLERLRLADFLYTEYSLEEVIYQLAKVIFTQSLSGGSADAQNALTKFVNFLEKEAEEGRISRALEKKVLDVLIAALSDTVNERPELINIRREMPQGNDNILGQQVLRQILEFPLEDRTQLQKSNLNFENGKDQIEKNIQLRNNPPMKNQKILVHMPYSIGRK